MGFSFFAMVISFSQRTDDLYDLLYCIVKTRPAESVHLYMSIVRRYVLGSEYYVIWMKGGFFKE